MVMVLRNTGALPGKLLQQILDHRRPGMGQVAAVVAPAAESQHPPVSARVGERGKIARRAAVHVRREAQVCDRIAVDGIGAALQDDEFRIVSRQVRHDVRPHLRKYFVVGPGGQRHVELHAGRSAAPFLSGVTRTRIEVASVLVQVGKHDCRVVLERVEDAVAVVCVDVDVGDPTQAAAFELLDGDAAVVEYAKTRRTGACRVMESRDRYEGATAALVHDRFHRSERRTDDARSRFVNALESRRVAGVEESSATCRAVAHELEILGGVKGAQLRLARNARLDLGDASHEVARAEFAHESRQTVGAERMPVAEAVARKTLTQHHTDARHRAAHAPSGNCAPKRPSLTQPRPGQLGAPIAIGAALEDNRPMAQYIYTMSRVSKVVPPKRVILRDISLSFFPGAKIGVLGLNGSGKSSLLKIMAGLDTTYDGEARPQNGIRIGFLPQEPQLDPAQDVRATVMAGLGATFAQLQEFNQISEKFAEPMDDEQMNALLARQAQLQDAIDAAGGWELERKLEIAADALRLPPWEASIGTLSGGEKRRVALCRLLLSAPDMLLLDEPTNHLDAESIGWLERYLEEYPSTVIAVTHDRYILDNVAE